MPRNLTPNTPNYPTTAPKAGHTWRKVTDLVTGRQHFKQIPVPMEVVREDEQEIDRMFNTHQLAGIRHEHNHLARGMHIEPN